MAEEPTTPSAVSRLPNPNSSARHAGRSSPGPGSAPWHTRTAASASGRDAPPWPSPTPCPSRPIPPRSRAPTAAACQAASPPAIPPPAPGFPPSCEPPGIQRLPTPPSLHPCTRSCASVTSWALAAVAVMVWTIPVSESTVLSLPKNLGLHPEMPLAPFPRRVHLRVRFQPCSSGLGHCGRRFGRRCVGRRGLRHGGGPQRLRVGVDSLLQSVPRVVSLYQPVSSGRGPESFSPVNRLTGTDSWSRPCMTG